MTAGPAAGAVLVHLGLLAWDREVTVDPVTGSTTGPYAAWQVVGCAVALGLLGLSGRPAGRRWVTAAAVSLASTAAWSVGAATAPGEDADLWPVGAALLAPGVFAWVLLVGLVAQRTARRRTTADPPA